jgi:hypothetical protein
VTVSIPARMAELVDAPDLGLAGRRHAVTSADNGGLSPVLIRAGQLAITVGIDVSGKRHRGTSPQRVGAAWARQKRALTSQSDLNRKTRP